MLTRHSALALQAVSRSTMTLASTRPAAAACLAAAAAVPAASARTHSFHTSAASLAHNPRTLCGVGPAPRTVAFWRRPWLRRRLAQVRAKHWPQTHPTKPLAGEVVQATQPTIELPTRSLQSSTPTGSVHLSPSIFSVPLRRDVVWDVVRWQRACRRTGHHKNKNRSEVFGSGKKFRPQKGTGRARMGDPHAPHHVGGGNTWARRQSDYSYKLPQHIINMGKRVALSAKVAEGNLFVIDQPTLDGSKSYDFRSAMQANGWGTFTLIHLHGELDANLALASRKFDEYDFLSDRQLNVLDIVKAKRLVVTRKALQAIEWRLTKANTDAKTQSRTMRWMVGSYGGGYTRQQVDFVRPTDQVDGEAKIVPGVDVDGLKLVLKVNQPYETPVHWP